MRRALPWLALLLCGCAAAPPPWQTAEAPALAAARADGRDVAVFFALPGREQSDRMETAVLRDAAVLDALRRGGFQSLRLDGFARQRLFAQWIGGGEGMGVCVLDAQGRAYAARPGPQDAPELAAFLDFAAAHRDDVLAARAELARAAADGLAEYRLGVLLLELGCRVGTDELLITAAQRGVVDAHHRLARLYALDGLVERSRQWLRSAVPSPERTVTEGYVLFKERRHAEAAAAFEQALQQGVGGQDRLRARLYLGKALHEHGRDDEARQWLLALVADAPATTFGAAAAHTLTHMQDPTHDHSH